MKEFAPIAVFAVLLASCSAEGEPAELEVTDFRFGLACAESIDADRTARPTVICFETSEILITGQGQCMASGTWVPCTWYGFEFDYSGAKAGTIIECETQYTTPQNIVSSTESPLLSLGTFVYPIELKETAGRYFQPQYSVFAYGDDDEDEIPVESTTTCRHNDQTIFQFDEKIVFPTPDRATR